jgi:drug/metabolite transporter (DMT)-like permease
MTPFLRQHRVRLIIAFAMLYVLWGSTFLAIAVAVKYMPPTVMGATRFLASGGIMLLWCLLTGRKVLTSPKEMLQLGVIGVLLLTGGNVVVGWAEKYVPSGLAALLLAVTPIWVAIIEAWILKSDRLSRRGLVGLALGTAGLGILLWPKLQNTSALGRMELFGCIALIFAALSWTVGSLVSKRSQLGVDVFTATGWQMLLAGIFNSGLALAFGHFRQVHWNAASVWSITYLVVGGSLLGFTAYIWLLEHVATAKVATYSYVNPVVAVILGVLVLKERFDGFMLAGTAVIVVGVILVTTSKVRAGVASLPAKHELPACEAEA